ncbi:EAL domain-containing protein [Maridesulfovibrio sp.]|uniref:sensor domain-containing protein n=1 Tax=Maridesulfovibrio sp. TaxID=2795000 RepID=UPI002A1875C4|nr:EAL domain-containing protein [Maridesulfovibrio sp.]
MTDEHSAILARFLDNASHIAIIKDPLFRFIYTNKPFFDLLDMDRDSDITGKTDADILTGIASEKQLSEIASTDRKACTLAAGEHLSLEFELTIPCGKTVILKSYKFPIRDKSGSLLGIGVLTADISQLKSREQELIDTHHALTQEFKEQAEILRDANENLQFMRHVFKNTLDGIIITDKDGKALQINPAFTEITGYTLDEIRGENPRFLKSNYHNAEFYKEMWASLASKGFWEGELWNRRKSGEIYPQRLNISAIYDQKGNITHYVGVNNDISELKRKEEKIHFYSYHDALTNLPNRKLFSDRLRREIEKSAKTGVKIALLYMDLDDFKKVNDSLGYTVGDELLKQLAGRIKPMLGEQDSLARLGSDEFAVALVGYKKINNIISFAQKIGEQLSSPFHIEGHEIFINASIGIATYPEDTTSPEQLVLHADTAMHQVKSSYLDNFRFYTSQMKTQAQHKIDMESAIRKGIVNGEFVPFYQAKVSTSTGKVMGMEALARWVRPDGSIIPPSEFIPIAEELNLIHEVDTLIIRQAVKDMTVWEEAGYTDLVVSANVSAKELDTPAFAENIFAILEESHLPKEKLDLEITESLLMQDVEKNAGILDSLCSSGISCSIDDFGTGYSSLSYLKKLPISTLKIDRSFVNDIMTDKNDLAIVCAIISMAKHMGLKVVAEGVEDAEQVKLLKSQGCDLIQGFYYSKPLSKSEFLNFLNGRRDNIFLQE